MDDVILQAVITGLIVGIIGAIVYYRGNKKKNEK